MLLLVVRSAIGVFVSCEHVRCETVAVSTWPKKWQSKLKILAYEIRVASVVLGLPIATV